MFKELKEDVSSLRKEVTELKSSLTFSQGDIDQLKKKANKLPKRLLEECKLIDECREDIDCLEDHNQYLENQSRRNNIKILGVKEDKDKEKTWDDTEIIVKDLIKKKLNYEVEIEIERAHRVGKKHRRGREDGSGKTPSPAYCCQNIQLESQRSRTLRSSKNKARRCNVLQRPGKENTQQKNRTNS